jgi:hypothetical protein
MKAEPAKPSHDRKLGLLGVSLTKARLRKDSGVILTSVRDEIEGVMIERGFLTDAPFSWVTLSIRYGIKMELEPHFQPINKKYGDLPLAIEVETEIIQNVEPEQLRTLFKRTVLRALIAAGHRYNRPVSEFVEMLDALPPTPDSPPTTPRG